MNLNCQLCGHEGEAEGDEDFVSFKCLICGFHAEETSNSITFKLKKWKLAIDCTGPEQKGKLYYDDALVGEHPEILSALEFLLATVPPDTLKDARLKELRQRYINETGFGPHP
jgi:hypothetical protein